MNFLKTDSKRSRKEVESYLGEIDLSLFNLQLENNTFWDKSVRTTIQKLLDVKLFGRFEKKYEFLGIILLLKKNEEEFRRQKYLKLIDIADIYWNC